MNVETTEIKTGVIQNCYYGKTKETQKPYCSGEISFDNKILDFFFIVDKNNTFLIKGDIVNFNIYQKNNHKFP